MANDSNEAVLQAIADLRGEVGSLRGDVDGLHTKFDGLHSELTSVRSAVMDRIDRVQNSVERLRSDMTVNWATADTAIKNARAHQDEVRQMYDLFSAMQRQIQVLSTRVDDLEARGSAAG